MELRVIFNFFNGYSTLSNWFLLNLIIRISGFQKYINHKVNLTHKSPKFETFTKEFSLKNDFIIYIYL